MFMQIAIGAIGIGIVLMVGYLVIAQVRTALPTVKEENPCYGLNDTELAAADDCTTSSDNTSEYINDTDYTNAVDSTQSTVFAGFGLVAVGIIVLAAFGLINVFK